MNGSVKSPPRFMSSRGTMAVVAFALWAVFLLAAKVLLPVANAAAPKTIVSIEFDDDPHWQWNARQTLIDHGMHATFFVNSGLTTNTPGGWRLTWDQLHQLALDGNEIGGHTLDHNDLTTMTTAQAQNEICTDRQNLLAQGFTNVTSFAYPFGAYNSTVESIVKGCGYTSGRTVGGTYTTDNQWAMTYPYAESFLPPDPYATRTPTDIRNTTSLATEESYVTNAENNGGGWIQIVMHLVCVTGDTDCSSDEFSTQQTQLVAFLDWLQPRAAQGTVVETVGQVINGGTAPADTTPPSNPTGVKIASSTGTSATVSWTASTDNVAVTGYDLYLNGAAAGTTTATSNTFSNLKCGTSYTFGVDAFDAAGNKSGITTVTGSTAACTDTTPPSNPTGLTLTGSTMTSLGLGWTASTDNVGVTGYDLYLNGSAIGTTTGTTNTFSNLKCGTAYTLGVDAYDAAGNKSGTVTLNGTTAACDTTPPTVSLTAPAGGTMVSGSAVTVSANASDNVGVAGVQFKLDGVNLGSEDTATPYTVSWNTLGASNGTHTLTAVARDAAGTRQHRQR